RAADRAAALRGDRRAGRAPCRGRSARDGRVPAQAPHARALGALARPAAVSTALRVRGVAKHFGEVQALRGISFDAGAGEVVAVVGPNGAGKTTLLSIIAGTHRPDAGSVERTSSAAARGADI